MNIIDGKSYEKAIEYINSLSQFVAGTGCERAEKLLKRQDFQMYIDLDMRGLTGSLQMMNWHRYYCISQSTEDLNQTVKQKRLKMKMTIQRKRKQEQ